MPILAIFGTDSKDIISLWRCRCRTRPRSRQFVAGYEQMHRWRKMPDGSQVLLIGAA